MKSRTPSPVLHGDCFVTNQTLAERFPSQIKFGTGYNDELFAGAFAIPQHFASVVYYLNVTLYKIEILETCIGYHGGGLCDSQYCEAKERWHARIRWSVITAWGSLCGGK